MNLRTWINLYPVYKAIDLPNRPNTYPVAHAWDSLCVLDVYFFSVHNHWMGKTRKKDRKNEEMRWKADYQLSVNVKGCSKRGNTFAEMFV